MNAQQWRAEQRRLRETLRSQRRTSDGRRPATAPSQAPSPTGDPPAVLASVIVVCWNAAATIGECLEHLLAQDYANYEVIVVDDGSEDETAQIAEGVADGAKLTVLRSPANRGCPHARNLGMRRANGEIVAFVDADGFAAPSWLRQIVGAFAGDSSIGGVASTVFLASSPLVINGAGGIVNRQGWAADLSMNEPYERAEIASEALYPMGCGMAVRRCAAEAVGPFDDRMLNYYDDVDYGTRLWRAGYRVVVAPDAWIDHDFNLTGGDSARKALLCERHRMRVVLKHSPAVTLVRWAGHEAGALMSASPGRRVLKLRAMAWNALHLRSALVSRRRLSRAATAPERLMDPSWGDGFPAGVPSLPEPRPERAGSRVDMADAGSEDQLLYGWFPAETADGRSYRWSAVQAAALIHLEAPVRRLRLDYAPVPVDVGGLDLSIRRVGSADPLETVWGTHLAWQYVTRSIENHPLALPAGDYEAVFDAPQGWSDPPRETRALGFALSGMSFEEAYEIAPSGLDMASPEADEQLVCGWFGVEHVDRSYRWAAGHAAAVVRLPQGARGVRLVYRLPPASIGGLRVSVWPLEQDRELWSTGIAWLDSVWHEDSLPLQLAGGDYVVMFDAEAPWSPEGKDPTFAGEHRSLGFALSSLVFEA
jgi:GT2 family glycosyltransferase